METVVNYILAIIIGGFLLGCSVFILFSPFIFLVWLAKGVHTLKRDPSVKDEIIQAQYEYNQKYRRRD